MKRFLLVACAALVSLTLLAGCKPKSPPDSGRMGDIAGGVHDRAVQATNKVNEVREQQNKVIEDSQHEAAEGSHK
jgi:hypothetical protein